MKKMPLFFQALGDTLFFLPHLFHVPIARRKKIRVIFTWIRLTLVLFLLAPFKKISHEKMLLFNVNFFDYRTFHLLFRHIFIRNDYFFRAETNTPLILDCGANIGFATFYFKWLYPMSEIHAFEPDPSTFHLLQKNLNENNFLNVASQCAAISNKNGDADFYLDKNKPGAIQMSLLPRNFKDTVKVRTLSLSSYIQETIGKREIDFLKLDLEGIELKAMQDLTESGCLRQAREVFIEYHHRMGNSPSVLAGFLKILEVNGFDYSMDTFYTNHYGEDKFQCINIFAIRKNIK